MKVDIIRKSIRQSQQVVQNVIYSTDKHNCDLNLYRFINTVANSYEVIYGVLRFCVRIVTMCDLLKWMDDEVDR